MSSSAPVPHFDVNIDAARVTDDFRQILRQVRPLWKPENVRFWESPMDVSHGLLNKMVKCYDGDNENDALMIRVLNPKTTETFGNDRSSEVNAIKYFHPRGCAPKIVATFSNGFSYEFIHGEILSAPRLKEEKIWRSVAEETAKFHNGTYEDGVVNRENNANIKWLQEIIKSYPPTFEDKTKDDRVKKNLPSRQAMQVEFDAVFNHVLALGSPLVFSHNDTRAENIVWNEANGRVHFVDFEMVGYTQQAFDIASHFCYFAGITSPDYAADLPDEELQHKWIRVYLRKLFELNGRDPDDVTDVDVRRLYVQVSKWLLMVFLAGVLYVASWAQTLDEPGGELDFIQFAEENMKQYYAFKGKAFALEVPN